EVAHEAEKTDEKESMDNGLRYKIKDIPLWYLCIGFGFQKIIKSQRLAALHLTCFASKRAGMYRGMFAKSRAPATAALFGVRGDWLYFEAVHGKGPCEGVGCAAKRRAAAA
ncbi:hypothetical protein LSAT2_013594, partial [Lamellibrachia satsuma]